MPGAGGRGSSSGGAQAAALSAEDRALVCLYMAGCYHHWEQLPDLARECYASGLSVAQLRGAVRHLIVFAGYGPCLAATLTLHKAKLLPEDSPGKAGGEPGNGFELVYTGVTDAVRKKMHAVDPVMGEWIRLHLYGDIYSSPGLDLRCKQLLTCAFLSSANMPDQLFGHALAALRFGNTLGALQEAARLAAAAAPRLDAARLKAAMATLDLAQAKYFKDFADQEPSCPEVTIPDPSTVCLPPLPPPYNPPPSAAQPRSSLSGDASVRVDTGPAQPGSKELEGSSSGRPARGSLQPAEGSTGQGGATSNARQRSSLAAVDDLAAVLGQQQLGGEPAPSHLEREPTLDKTAVDKMRRSLNGWKLSKQGSFKRSSVVTATEGLPSAQDKHSLMEAGVTAFM